MHSGLRGVTSLAGDRVYSDGGERGLALRARRCSTDRFAPALPPGCGKLLDQGFSMHSGLVKGDSGRSPGA
jgi:hypothetical protein